MPSCRVWLELPFHPLLPVPMASRLTLTPDFPSGTRSRRQLAGSG